MKKIFRLTAVIILEIIVFSFFGCNTADTEIPLIEVSDYSKTQNWLKIPSTIDKDVDIFYFYPTAWTPKENDGDICEINNASMLASAISAYNRQATAFETVGNIYAPYYRQVSILASNREEIADGIPTLDGIAAFDYYIKNYNNGRPYILAGHSQGSQVLSNLLSSYMKENPDVYERMIAAYVIGWPITAEYLTANPHLKFAEGADDTGVIISYNTQSPNVLSGENIIMSDKVGVVINPINWKRDETLATTLEGLGSFMPDMNTLESIAVPQYADAKIDIEKGVLICSTADEDDLYPITQYFGRGIYHSFDYSFYYQNIRQNAADRTENFLDK